MAPQSEPSIRNRQIWLQKSDQEIRLFYTEALPPANTSSKGNILLIHGFPETSYQFRHIIPPLARAGYHVIAPDYRGAGYSSKPPSGYTKKQLSADLHQLMTQHLGIKDPIHVVGHDIGGMIAHAYAAQFPSSVASVIWGECPLPGSTVYEETKHSRTLWHFDFHSTPEISLALVAGKEKLYIKHFYDRLAQNPAAFSNDDVEFYAGQYSAPGAMRAGFATYAAFEEDAEHNRQWLKEGKLKSRSLVLSGQGSFIAEAAAGMAGEFYEDTKAATVEGSGHW